LPEGNPGAVSKSPTCIRRFRIVRINGTAGIHNKELMKKEGTQK